MRDSACVMPFWLRLTALVLGTLGACCGVDVIASQQSPLPVFPVRSDLVVVQARVTDGDGTRVSGLTADAFAVWDDGRPQTIQFFGRENTPVTIGLVLDTSGSMFAERESVIAAIGSFAESNDSGDEIFALVFNQGVRPVLPLDLPFTNDLLLLRGAMSAAISASGWTAFHDAVATGLRHVKRGSHARTALVVVGDGGDNASASSFRDLMRTVATSETAIYTVALVNPADPFAHPQRLKQLAGASGGEAFRPRSTRDVEDAFRRIVSEVRTTYTIGYAPAEPADVGERRRIRVAARAHDGRALRVRARDGYMVEKR
jgi:Ca-activated chloride channel homolog